jgi:hypothetical protein
MNMKFNITTKTKNWITIASMLLLALNQLMIAGLVVKNIDFLVKLLAWTNNPLLGPVSVMTVAAFGAIVGIYWLANGDLGGKLL